MLKQQTNSSYAKDFLAGIEPTGVHTFSHGAKNTRKHKTHQAVGDAGGFLGGFGMSALMGAGGAGAAAAVLKRTKFKMLGKVLGTGAKDAAGVLNPMGAIRSIRRLPEAMSLSMRHREIANSTEKIVNRAGNIWNKPKIDTNKVSLLHGSAERRVMEPYKALKTDSAAFEAKHNMNAFDATRKGMAVVGAGAAAGLGGGLNALSAHAQYSAGRKQSIAADKKLYKSNKKLKQLGFKYK